MNIIQDYANFSSAVIHTFIADYIPANEIHADKFGNK